MRYVIGDTHFGHGNLIEYCDRPFDGVESMNDSMVERWNDAVDESDTVIHLGDVRHHPDPNTIEHWFERLNGTILLVRGNHDNLGQNQSFHVVEQATIQHGRYQFYVEHEPVGVGGWQIHGHAHNNDLFTYPFIHRGRQSVNVSADLIGFKPLRMDDLVRILDRSVSERLTHIDDAPV